MKAPAGVVLPGFVAPLGSRCQARLRDPGAVWHVKTRNMFRDWVWDREFNTTYYAVIRGRRRGGESC